MSLLNPLLLLLLWSGASFVDPKINITWPQSTRNTYYFLLVIGGSMLIPHVEEDVADRDIKDGRLSGYLLKPFSYFWNKFFQEIPYRLLQGFYGILIFLIVSFLGVKFTYSNNVLNLALTFLIIILAYVLSFTYKMIIGIWAFWMVDIWGIYQITEIALLIFGGFVMPINLYPHWLQTISYFTPFPYMIYFPLISFQGQLSTNELFFVISKQLLWIALLKLVYSFLWQKGLKKFTGIGQ